MGGFIRRDSIIIRVPVIKGLEHKARDDGESYIRRNCRTWPQNLRSELFTMGDGSLQLVFWVEPIK